MTTTVAVIPMHQDPAGALRQAVDLLGGIEPLNLPERDVTIKIGLFDPRQHHHTTLPVLQAITGLFERAPRIRVAESDNYCGKALDRLERFAPLYNERVQPHSLSEDPQAEARSIAGEQMLLSPALFKPNVLVSTHVLRNFTRGSILKNLFGCTPMVQKARYHKTEVFYNQLCDLFEASGGIDLAVLDGTYLSHGASDKQIHLDLLIVGRDAVAVETVGMVLAGLKPEKNELIQAFVARGLGEGNLNNIQIVGVSPEEFARLAKCYKELKKIVAAAPRGPGVSDTIDLLTEEGWLDQPRSAQDVSEQLQARGVTNATRVLTETTLKRRAGKTLERVRQGKGWVYQRKQG